MALGNWQSHLTIHNIIVIILVIIGLIWLIHSLWRNYKISRINSWPRANALVVNSLVEPDGKFRLFSSSALLDPQYIDMSGKGNAKYIPRIVYRYNVNGKEYQSSNVVYGGDKAYNSLAIRALTGHITTGSTIQVYYNPSNPSEAYIYNGRYNWLGVVVGLLLLLIAAALGYHHNFYQVNAASYNFNFPGFGKKNDLVIDATRANNLAARTVTTNLAARPAVTTTTTTRAMTFF